MKKISPKQAKWVSVIILCVALVFVVVRYFIGGAPFMYAGTLETAKVILSSHVSSDVKSILVVEGDTVHADELLMELSCDTQKIAAIQIDSDYERTVELHRREHVAQAEYDNAVETFKRIYGDGKVSFSDFSILAASGKLTPDVLGIKSK